VESCMTVREFSFEIQGNVTVAAIRAYCGRGLFVIDHAHGYVNGTYRAFVEGDNRNGTQHPTIVLTNCEDTGGAPLSNVVTAANATNGAAYQFSWVIEQVGVPEYRNIFDASNWVSSGTPVWNGLTANAVIPEKFKTRYRARYVNINDHIVAGQLQEFPDLYDFPRASSLYDASAPVGVITPTQIGQTFVKTSAPKEIWVSTGLTSSDWTQTA